MWVIQARGVAASVVGTAAAIATSATNIKQEDTGVPAAHHDNTSVTPILTDGTTHVPVEQSAPSAPTIEMPRINIIRITRPYNQIAKF